MSSLDPRISTLYEKIHNLEEDMEAVKSLLQKLLSEGGKIDLNLTVRELAVNLKHAGNVTIDLDTTNTGGQVIFCALKDLERKPFTWSEISAKLDERGWHMPSGTLAPTLSRLVKKKLLIKEQKGYRLPSKVTFQGADV